MRYILAIALSVFVTSLSAQEKQFPKDETGKFIYYKVVDSLVLSKTILLERAKNFVVSTNKKTMKLESSTDTSILAKGKMIIDKTILVAGHPSGEVSYDFVFEARAGKYRYWLTNFIFIPYQRDRYGNFVPKTTIGSPLEKSADKLNAGSWKDIQTSTYAEVAKFGDSFKKFLATDKKNSEPVKKETVSTKKW
ncbi:DUF4468 domain-containing protein [Pedobacter sp. G11]|uniref:DUF4468 domain-containing protein n=1 Tax=Pedobacter sp. G11 TaxID=2482728 RepID=UPI000F5E6053|nr:DUF4468 domain-containing protein [Pedobacter sp. G11]AZI23837.1 DUF4468 domain-containing protein [Pedobacter sp. G11]